MLLRMALIVCALGCADGSTGNACLTSVDCVASQECVNGSCRDRDGGAQGDSSVDTPTDVTTDVRVDAPSSDARFVVVDPVSMAGVAGAMVSAVLPDGSSVFAQTDAAGGFDLPFTDFGGGKLSISVWKAGYRVGGLLDASRLTSPQERILLVPGETTVPDTFVTVTGTVSGLNLAADEYLTVGSDAFFLGDETVDSTFSVQVPAGRPFRLHARVAEQGSNDAASRTRFGDPVRRWFETEPNPAIMADTTIDLPAPVVVPLTRVSGSYGLPLGGPLTDTSSLQVLIYSGDGSPLIGEERSTQISRGRAEYEAEYVSSRTVFETIFILTGTGTSVIRVSGPPPEGTQGERFLEPVSVTQPMGENIHLLHDPIRVGNTESDVPLRLTFTGPGGVGGTVSIAAGSTEFRLPRPPEGLDTTNIVGAEPVAAFIQHCTPGRGYFCAVNSQSRRINLVP